MENHPIYQLKLALDKANLWQGPMLLSRGEFLTQPGTTDQRLYYVDKGSLRAFVMEGDEEHTVRFGYKTSFFAAIDSFVGGQPTNFYIQALKKSELKYISKASVRGFLKEQGLTDIWETLLSDLVLQQLERELDLLTYSPEERYQRVLSRSPQLFQHIPFRYIAAYLRMTPETLSRIRKS